MTDDLMARAEEHLREYLERKAAGTLFLHSTVEKETVVDDPELSTYDKADLRWARALKKGNPGWKPPKRAPFVPRFKLKDQVRVLIGLEKGCIGTIAEIGKDGYDVRLENLTLSHVENDGLEEATS